MKYAQSIQAFEARIGYRFKAPELLQRAMTHGSASSVERPDNQRLEFLGDRVLGLVIAEALMAEDKAAAEGQLAPRFNALVRKEACAGVARVLELGSVLRLGRSEMQSGGRRKEALLADAMEALIAAVYLDGGFASAKDFVLRHWADRIANVETDARDAKTSLQEWAQAQSMAPPTYALIARQGPDHAPTFEIEAQLASGQTARATASNKRQAEQAAALKLFNEVSDGEK